MGLNLYYTIIDFFENKMLNHSVVASFLRTGDKDEYVYEIDRSRFRDRLRVWLSDAYIFTEMEYLNKPREIIAGDYILIARPESMSWVDTTGDKIGIGKIGDFMGALNKKNMWTYDPPTAEEREARKQKVFEISSFREVGAKGKSSR